jgi:hypothetical protein
LLERIPLEKNLAKILRLIAIEDFCTGHHLKLVMDDELGRAVAYLEKDE